MTPYRLEQEQKIFLAFLWGKKENELIFYLKFDFIQLTQNMFILYLFIFYTVYEPLMGFTLVRFFPLGTKP